MPGALHVMVWGKPTIVMVRVLEVNEPPVPSRMTEPNALPVRVSLATPPEALKVLRPVTAPLPEVWVKVTLGLSVVTVLPLASSTVAVAVQVVNKAMFGEQPPSAIWLAGPGPEGEKLLLVAEVMPFADALRV
jgi:hypothetical protein